MVEQGCGARERASQARTRAAPGSRLVANKSRPPGAWLTDGPFRVGTANEKHGPVP